MAKRKKPRRPRESGSTTAYTDPDGNVLTLRDSLTGDTIRKIRKASASGAASIEDDWRRRTELLFERLAVRWEIAGLPLDDQKMLLGRYRLADAATQEWVRRTITEHAREHLPELED